MRTRSTLHRRRRASAQVATRLRHELAEWARRTGASADMICDIVLSTYEAMANAVKHAYPPNTVGPLELRAELDRDTIVITVADHGCWRQPDQHSASPGRGLALIRALSHRAAVVPGPHGTAVRMSWPTSNR
jgi:serine/threonine-protein kinase RsbW